MNHRYDEAWQVGRRIPRELTLVAIDEADHPSTSEAVAQQVWDGTFRGRMDGFIGFVKVPLPEIHHRDFGRVQGLRSLESQGKSLNITPNDRHGPENSKSAIQKRRFKPYATVWALRVPLKVHRSSCAHFTALRRTIHSRKVGEEINISEFFAR